MKKFTVFVLSICLFMTILPPSLRAVTGNPTEPITSTKNTESPEAKNLIKRLDEIKAMDKSNLTSAEKKQLRKETREIKKQLKAISGGIYLSVGAIVIIILLLILLL